MRLLKFITLERGVLGLRIALGLTFLWFGGLKVAGFNPVYDIIYASALPLLADGTGFLILGIFEVVIGVGLLLGILPIITDLALVGHLLGTLTVFFTGASVAFSPYFPILTLEGEFVFKNVVLLMAGFVVLRYNELYGKKK